MRRNGTSAHSFRRSRSSPLPKFGGGLPHSVSFLDNVSNGLESASACEFANAWYLQEQSWVVNPDRCAHGCSALGETR